MLKKCERQYKTAKIATNQNKCPPTCEGIGLCSGDHLFSRNAGWNSV